MDEGMEKKTPLDQCTACRGSNGVGGMRASGCSADFGGILRSHDHANEVETGKRTVLETLCQPKQCELIGFAKTAAVEAVDEHGLRASKELEVLQTRRVLEQGEPALEGFRIGKDPLPAVLAEDARHTGRVSGRLRGSQEEIEIDWRLSLRGFRDQNVYRHATTPAKGC